MSINKQLKQYYIFEVSIMKPHTTVLAQNQDPDKRIFLSFLPLRPKTIVFLCLVYWYFCSLDRERKLTSLISYAPVCTIFVYAQSTYLQSILVPLCIFISLLPHENNLRMHHSFANCFIFYFCGCVYDLMCLQLQISAKLESEAINLFFQEEFGGVPGKEGWHTFQISNYKQ